MKSIVLNGIKKLELREVPKPQLKSKFDVMLKIAAVGICGSDIHYFTEGRIGDQVVQYPFTIGHECTAIVEEIGSEVTRVKPGDHVVIDPLVSCGKCPQCLNGR
ncbi:MAG: alcohol dehydrogenase catalytic domain-containing protein, partial [Candidatus Hodarchaeota archaeon]